MRGIIGSDENPPAKQFDLEKKDYKYKLITFNYYPNKKEIC
jgi:hypothetical protein